MKTASLDLGSNSFLCLISEKTKTGELQVLEDLSIITRLGQGVQKEGALTKESLMRAAQAFETFAGLFEKHHVQQIKAVTTSAAREASNFSELQALGAQYKIPIEVISGEREAELSFKGAVASKQRRASLLVDIGGGSTEIAYYTDQDEKLFLKSLPLGTVRLGEIFIERWEDLNRESLERMREQVLKTLEVSWGKEKTPVKKWVAVAGTPTSLKAVELGEYDAERINNSPLTLDSIKKLNQMLIDLPLAERRKVKGLQAKRADVIPVGALILEALMDWASVTEVQVSTAGLRYGLAQEV